MKQSAKKRKTHRVSDTLMFHYRDFGLLSTNTQLQHTFTSVELVGHPLTLGHLVNTSTVGFIISATTYTYSPYLSVGQNDPNRVCASTRDTNDSAGRAAQIKRVEDAAAPDAKSPDSSSCCVPDGSGDAWVLEGVEVRLLGIQSKSRA
jgi:hypothetical protein